MPENYTDAFVTFPLENGGKVVFLPEVLAVIEVTQQGWVNLHTIGREAPFQLSRGTTLQNVLSKCGDRMVKRFA